MPHLTGLSQTANPKADCLMGQPAFVFLLLALDNLYPYRYNKGGIKSDSHLTGRRNGYEKDG